MMTWRRITAAAGLAVWALSLGCASTEKEREREQRTRRAQSHYELGVDHLGNGRPELALRELLLAERLDPQNPQIQFGLSNAYIFKGRLDEAEAHLIRALELYPEYHDARLNLSTLYVHERRWRDALVHTQVLIDDPTFPAPWRAHSNHGWVLLNLGQNAEARQHLQMAREYNPRYWPALLNLGILEQQAGHHLEAAEIYQRMLEMEPDPNAEAEANYRLAEIYISLGNRNRAMNHLVAAVTQSPNGEWGRKSEEYLKILR